VVELNRDGQLHQILQLEIPDCSMKLISLSHLDGLPLTADWVEQQVTGKEE
jgi:2-oxoglutarate ferredoxin oxidoreductase subunit alpha